MFCWNEHVVCENGEQHRRICAVALAWHVSSRSLIILSSFLPEARPAWAWLCNLKRANAGMTGASMLSYLFSSLLDSILLTHSSHNVGFYINKLSKEFGINQSTPYIGEWHIGHGQINSWNKGKCKCALFNNPGLITRGTREPRSHGTAALKTGMSKRSFQIIPVSQNNTVTHKYHLTSVWTKVNIRNKALSIASPTRFFIYIAYLAEIQLYCIFLPNLILTENKT